MAFGRTDEIKKRLGRHLETLAVTPHARLLGAVFGESQSPVPPEREAELTEAVEKQLETLIPREHQVLTLRFGLRDGITRTLEKVGRELTVTRERARQIEDKALRKLRQEVQGEKLRPYLTLPEDSFGREVFGAVLRQDLLQLDTSRRLDVSSETLEGLMPYQWFIDLWTGRSPADKFLTADLSGLPLSPQARKEIGEALRSLVVDERSQQETPSPQEPPAEISAEPPVNRLLAELFIPEDKLRALAQQTIESLELQTQAYHALKRAGVTTIGDLLKIPKGELLELRNLGKKGISELAEKLQELLELPTPDYPPGFIHSLLTAKDRKPPRKQKV